MSARAKKEPRPWIEAARQVVEEGQYTKVDGVLLDHFTASMLVQVHDALSPENQAKFGAMSLVRAVDVGWKVVQRAERRTA
jgi:hypothetical protein